MGKQLFYIHINEIDINQFFLNMLFSIIPKQHLVLNMTHGGIFLQPAFRVNLHGRPHVGILAIILNV